MKLWIDDVRPAPEGYVWCKSVNDTIVAIKEAEVLREYHINKISLYRLNGNLEHIHKVQHYTIELIDLDHDAGDYASDGGDYIRLLDWLEGTGHNYPIRIHSANAVGVQNMRRIIQRNGWKEVF